MAVGGGGSGVFVGVGALELPCWFCWRAGGNGEGDGELSGVGESVGVAEAEVPALDVDVAAGVGDFGRAVSGAEAGVGSFDDWVR